MARTPPSPHCDYERRYRELAKNSPPSASSHRAASPALHSVRQTDRCRCHADPPQLHGPYWHWSTKVNGKTVNRRLSDREAELYNGWIENDRKCARLLTQMRQVAAKAGEIHLATTAGDLPRPPAAGPSPAHFGGRRP